MKKIMLVGLLAIIVIVSGCIEDNNYNDDSLIIEDTVQITHHAKIEMKGTVVSLEGMGEDNNTAIVRIDEIISIDNPDNIDISDIYEGAELNSYFTYSFVPAKIRTFTEEVEGDPDSPDSTVSMSVASRDPIGYEDPYLIYEKGSNMVEEIILDGLSEGDQFTTTINYIEPTGEYFKITIDEYEAIA